MIRQSLYQLDLLLKQQSGPKDTAALIVEPVLGEGGYVPAPAPFLQGLRSICDQNDILLIVDEVQCGFGRTGKNFYIENSGVKPDIMVVAKVWIMDHVEITRHLSKVAGSRQWIPFERCHQLHGIDGQIEAGVYGLHFLLCHLINIHYFL